MRVLTSTVSVRVLSVFAVLAVVCAAPIGCGESGPPPATAAKEVTEIKKSNTVMEDFVKSKAQDKEKAK